jgi:hypothetical protein
MDIVEKNIEESFKRVKKDILSMQAHLLEVSGKQAEILEMINELSKKVENPLKDIAKRKTRRKSSEKK